MRYLIFLFFGLGLLLMPVSGFAQQGALPPLAPSPKAKAPKAKTDTSKEKTNEKTDNTYNDLTIRSEADRARILDDLFKKLKNELNEQNAQLISEEIWAVFLQSGSASVDFLLHRGIAAQNNGNLKLARRMYDHVLRLQPDYAEGWSRSGRLAADEKDLSRAVNDTTQALILEPRHFYALWTLGNILETLGRREDAFEVYEQAAKIYPKHPEIKARIDALKNAVRGKAL